MIVDAFAGAGGWDLALRELGHDALGIEIDDAACATRRAAGVRTLQADVAALDPGNFGCCTGFIASPPCPTYSSAGGRAGALLTEIVLAALRDLADGKDSREQRRHEAYEMLIARGTEPGRACRDADTSLLVVEPLRWALALEPGWIALEQVPPVLPIWRAVAEILRKRGYSVWTGVLEAERYGVPQTRDRAILMASRVWTVEPPSATHQRYVPGESARREYTLDGEVLPWVSMAQALGMVDGDLPAPAPTVSGGGTGARGGVEVFAGRDARRRVLQATQSNGSTGRYGERDEDEPAFTVAPNSDRWMLRSHQTIDGGDRAYRDMDEPAVTVCSGTRSARWVPASTSELQSADWPERRPATTIAGDPRVFQPGGHHQPGQQSKDAVRVTIEQAAILQTFPADYPWQGSRSAQYLQCGNAVPPLLARAILLMLVEPAESARAAA